MGYASTPQSNPTNGSPVPMPDLRASRTTAKTHETACALFGLIFLWMQLRYQSFLLNLYPRKASMPELQGIPTLPAWAFFFLSVTIVSIIVLIKWQAISDTLARKSLIVPLVGAIASAGACMVLLTDASSPVAFAAYAIGSIFVGAGVCTSILIWIGHIATSFSAGKIALLAFSYLLSLAIFGSLRGANQLVASAMTAICPICSTMAWFFAIQPGRLTESEVTQTHAQIRWFDLTDVFTGSLVIFLLAGSVMRGIIDAGGSPNPSLRLGVSLWFAAMLALSACVHTHLQSSARTQPTGQEGETRLFQMYALVVWAGFSITLFGGLIMYLSRTEMAIGAYMCSASCSVLEVLLVCVICELCSRRSVNFVPVAVTYGIALWLVRWAISYVLVPACIIPSQGALPPKGGLQLVSIATWLAVAASIVGLSVSAFVSGQRQAQSRSGEFVFRFIPSMPKPDTTGVRHGDASTGSAPMGTDWFASLTGAYGLTCREAQVAMLFARGYSLGHVSEELGIAKSTAQGYIKASYRKLDIHSKDELLDLIADME